MSNQFSSIVYQALEQLDHCVHFLWIPTVVASIAELSLLADSEWDGLQQLAAQAVGQALQCGQVFDLQIVRCDVAVCYCATVELAEELLEDIVDADSCQKVALLYVAVQWLWDEPFVAGGMERVRVIKNKPPLPLFENVLKYTLYARLWRCG